MDIKKPSRRSSQRDASSSSTSGTVTKPGNKSKSTTSTSASAAATASSTANNDDDDERISVRAEDLKVVGDLGAGSGGTVNKVVHQGTGLIMAKKVRGLHNDGDCNARAPQADRADFISARTIHFTPPGY
jgi:mitogen-activated protein kinase kinase